MTKKILIVGPSWVGDMMMVQTLFKLIKQQLSDTIIDVLAPAWSSELLQFMPEVRKILAAPFNHGDFKLRPRYQFAKTLRNENYDQAIVLPGSWKSALIPLFANIPLRTGFRGEMRYGLLNDLRKLNKTQTPLLIQRFAQLAFAPNTSLPSNLPYPQLMLSSEQTQTIIKQFDLNCEKPILALCPGAEYGPAKRWPAAYFAEVANHYLAKGWQVWLLGSTKDQIFSEEIMTLRNQACIDLTGKTRLSEAVHLLSVANIVVSNDSGLMHIASSLNRKLIAIYGSSDPHYTPPLAATAKIISLNLACSPCFKRECPLGHLNCLNKMTPKYIFNALNELELCVS